MLVWQDFLFACAAYSEEEPLRGEVIAEAREAVTRLSRTPQPGAVERLQRKHLGLRGLGLERRRSPAAVGARATTPRCCPEIVAELDPTRPYSPGSPYSFPPDLHPNDPAHGTMHIWDVWNERDYTVYRDYRPRFVAEFGFQAPPTWATLTRSIHDDPISPRLGRRCWSHQKADDGNGKLARGLRGHLPAPTTFNDWHWATSLNQARAVAFGIEHFRSLMPTCMGTLVWQLNDVWPVTSWAAIDGDGRPKPLWYALRRVFADRLLTIQPRDGRLAVIAVNDTGERWHDRIEVARHAYDGTVLASAVLHIDVPARGAATIRLAEALTLPGDAAREVLAVRSGGAATAWWPYAEDVDADLPVAECDVTTEPVDGGVRVVVTARAYIRDLAILADRVAPSACVDDMLVTLLPGESATFVITGADGSEPAAYTGPLVLRSANQLVTASKGAG